MMAWTRQILRAWSALCLALVLYGATPHVHAETDGPRRSPSDAVLATGASAEDGSAQDAAASRLRRDDAHESHSSTASNEAHPCTLCRDKGDRELAAPSPASSVPPASALRLRIDRRELAVRAELLLARRHPARGPPHVG